MLILILCYEWCQLWIQNDLETQKALCCFEDHQQETKSRTCWQLQHLAEILCIDNDVQRFTAVVLTSSVVCSKVFGRCSIGAGCCGTRYSKLVLHFWHWYCSAHATCCELRCLLLIHKTLSNNGRSRYQRSFWSLKPPVSQYLCGQEFQISISHIRNSIIVSMLSTWGQWRADRGAKARVSVNLGHRGWLLDTAGEAVIAAA